MTGPARREPRPPPRRPPPRRRRRPPHVGRRAATARRRARRRPRRPPRLRRLHGAAGGRLVPRGRPADHPRRARHRRAHLVGASMGAGVAVEAALARPGLVASLLLQAPGGSLDPEDDRRPARLREAENDALEAGDLDAAAQANVRHLAGRARAERQTRCRPTYARSCTPCSVAPSSSPRTGTTSRRPSPTRSPWTGWASSTPPRWCSPAATTSARSGRPPTPCWPVSAAPVVHEPRGHDVAHLPAMWSAHLLSTLPAAASLQEWQRLRVLECQRRSSVGVPETTSGR